ncbi:hypothetical protein [Jannaschia sp. R86511]|uniref:hypothetical protein n=1 Tax=Jannaschia sp. R86511 TaxID=3093853 RepID=UPI0036D2DFD8
MVLSAVATFIATGNWLERRLDMLPTGEIALLEFSPLLSGAVLTLALSALVLGGSPMSRVVGIAAAGAGLLPLMLPLVLFGVSLGDVGPVAVPWAFAIALHCATALALLLPARGLGRRRSVDGAVSARGGASGLADGDTAKR